MNKDFTVVSKERAARTLVEADNLLRASYIKSGSNQSARNRHIESFQTSDDGSVIQMTMPIIDDIKSFVETFTPYGYRISQGIDGHVRVEKRIDSWACGYVVRVILIVTAISLCGYAVWTLSNQ